MTSADRDAGDVRPAGLAAPGHDGVVLGGDGGVVDELEVEAAVVAEHAAAVQEADLHAAADPAADDGVGVDDEQHGRGGAGDPQHPADQAVVVEHGEVRAQAGVGAGVDGDRAGEGLRRAEPTTRAGTRE